MAAATASAPRVWIDPLESRILLSWGDPLHLAHDSWGPRTTTATPGLVILRAVNSPSSSAVDTPADDLNAPYTPAEVQSAYGVNLISFDGTAGTGAGETIAIVDAFNDPDIITDANSFSSNFDLPQFNGSGDPTLTVLNETGGTSLPSNATPGGWDTEESLDVEWAHAIAPEANIVLFEASSADTQDLFTTVRTAADYSGVSVVSMSWTGPEFEGETLDDSIFTTPKGHQGVTFLAGTGDDGAADDYPAMSPNVVAVGGTDLLINSDGSYDSESAWSDGGGGISQYESQPSYQVGKVNGLTSTNRATPDVSAIADPSDGVYVLDTYYNSSYLEVGGTSLATPVWGGLIAIANQGRAINDLGTLNGATQTLPDLYDLPASDFHDITTGSNGNPATTGYDLATGLGSPVANLLVPALAGFTPSAAHLVFTEEPGTATAGVAISPSVQVSIEDADDNVITTDNSAITITIENGPGSLAGSSTTTVDASDGVASFSNLVLDTTGNYTFAAADNADGLSGTVSNSFTVDPASAEKIVIATPPSNTTAGVAISPGVTVDVEDQFGNLVTSGTPTVTMSVNSGPGSLGGTDSVNASGGIAKFTNLVIDTAGTYTLIARDSSMSATSGSFKVSPASASKLEYAVGPSNTTAGVAIDPSIAVAVEDQFGNLVTSGSPTVTLSVSSGPSGSAVSGTISVSATDGQAVFSNAILDEAGTYTLVAQSTGTASATSSSFNVTAAAASKLVYMSQPTNTTAGNAIAPSVLVDVEDSFGNLVTTNTDSIAMTVHSGPGALTGTESVSASGGQATFNDLVLDTAGAYSLTATDSAHTSLTVNSNNFNVTAASASKLVYITGPSNSTAGDAIAPPMVVDVEDKFGNLEAGSTAAVTLAINTGPTDAVIAAGSTTTVDASGGQATFSNIVLDTAGGYTLSATSPTLTSATSGSFTVSASTASDHLVYLDEPGNATAGQAGPTTEVEVEDAENNLVTTDTSEITLAVNSGPGTLGGTDTVAASGGIAKFANLILDTAGSYTLTASDAADGLSGVISSGFTVSAAGASQLVYSTQPVNGTAGSALTSVVLTIEDPFNNVETGDNSAVEVSAVGPGPFTGGSTASVNASGGVAKFSNLILDTAGGYHLTASDTSDTLSAGSSNSFTVNPTTASQLVFVQNVSNATAGVANTPAPVVAVEDQYGNVVTGNTSTISLSVKSGPGALSGTDSVAAVSGEATFTNLVLDTAGNYTLSATDAPLAGATSDPFTVNAASSVNKLVFVTGPSNATAGVAIDPSVQVDIEDQFGNIIGTDNSSVTLAVNSGLGALGGTATVSAAGGQATFGNLVLDTAGSYTLTASDGADTVAVSASFNVTAGAASKLVYVAQPTNTTAGVAIAPSVAVDVEDQFGNIVTGDTSTVTLTIASGPSGSTLAGTLSAVVSAGQAKFSDVLIDGAGNYTLSAGDSAGSVTGAVSNSFTVNAAAAAKLVYVTEPTNTTAGVAVSPAVVVDVEDQFGNLETGLTSAITLTIGSGPAGGTLSGTSTVDASGGQAAFSNLVLDTAGNYTLVAKDTADGLTSSPSSSFTVSASTTGDHLVFVHGPGSATAGAAISPAVTVQVEDSMNNLVSTDTSNVTLAVNTGPGALGGTVTVQASGGIATFSNLILDTAGAYTLSATDSPDTGATSTSFDVSPAVAEKLVFTTEPANASAGAALATVGVSIEDQFGNVETSDNSAVALSIDTGPAGGAFTSGSTTTVDASSGVAKFTNLVLDTAGGYTLGAKDSADSLTSSASDGFTISAATSGDHLVFVDEPGSATAGVAISPSVTVQVEDSSDNVVTTDSSNVTLAVNTGPGTLGGTVTVKASDGVAKFSNLILDTAGMYTLGATDSGDTAATSSPFDVAPAAAAKLVFTAEPAGAEVNATVATVDVTIEDQFGNVETSDSSPVTLSINSGPAGGAFTSSSTTTVDAVSGVARFTNLALDTAGTYTLAAADATDGLGTFVSDSFTITPLPVISSSGNELVFVQSPTNATAGSAISPAVTVDIENDGAPVSGDDTSVTLTIQSGPAGATLGGTVTVNASNGMATFTNLSLTTAGTYTLEATDSADSLTSAPSASFTINAAAAAKLAFIQPPTNAIAGQVINPAITVAVEDQYGNVVTTDNSYVTLSISRPYFRGRNCDSRFNSFGRFDGRGALHGTVTVQAVNGIATFSNLSLDKSGEYELVATDCRLKRARSVSFEVAPAAATRMVILPIPGFINCHDRSVSVEVLLLDAYGNVATGDDSTVTLSLGSHPKTGSLGGTLTATAIDGIATFDNLTVSAAGWYRLVAADSNSSAATVTSPPFFLR
ncbi:MAG: S53 family peptidase [Tepidisphaeraceae bacterium]|jgi:hypothetical protein